MPPSTLALIFQLVVLIYSVVLHELSHGLVARSMGDHTAEHMGRLTLNPFKHLDLFGSILLPLLLVFSRAPFVVGYAKPVPYDPTNLNDRKWGPSKVALAGPLTNLLLATAAGLFIRFTGQYLSAATVELLGYVVWINVVLAFFNLMPIPPLDGHWLLMAVLPPGARAFKLMLFRYQWFFLLVFIFFLFPLFYPLLAALANLLTGVRLF